MNAAEKKPRLFFLLLPENWEEKGHAIQHQHSCPMTPHHPTATLGQGLQGGGTLHRYNTWVTFEVKGNTLELDAGQTPSVKNIFRILKN